MKDWLLEVWLFFKYGLPTTALLFITTAKDTASLRSCLDKSGSKTTPTLPSRTGITQGPFRKWTIPKINTHGFQKNPLVFIDWSTSTTKPAWIYNLTTMRTSRTSSSQWLRKVKPVMRLNSCSFTHKTIGRTIWTFQEQILIYLKLIDNLLRVS